ncbi:hypothetical protein, partial [Prevotellamassilia timonensis]|uniref:hypothetical protein n=1 Tax=Prevotellamassilia timonensis TaxID=1852370 RepID=UPI004025B88B
PLAIAQDRLRFDNKNESFETFVLYCAHLALWLSPKIGFGSTIKTKVLRLSFCIALTLHYLCRLK